MGHYGCSGWMRFSSPPCRCRYSRGFGLRLRCGKRFVVQRLRARFLSLFGVLQCLRHRYGGRALRLFRCRGGGKKNGEGFFGSLERNESSRVWLVQRGVPCSLMTMKSCEFEYNTFHAEAIADCLEFIKGTCSGPSVVVSHGDDNDDNHLLRQVTEDDDAKS